MTTKKPAKPPKVITPDAPKLIRDGVGAVVGVRQSMTRAAWDALSDAERDAMPLDVSPLFKAKTSGAYESSATLTTVIHCAACGNVKAHHPSQDAVCVVCGN